MEGESVQIPPEVSEKLLGLNLEGILGNVLGTVTNAATATGKSSPKFLGSLANIAGNAVDKFVDVGDRFVDTGVATLGHVGNKVIGAGEYLVNGVDKIADNAVNTGLGFLGLKK